MVNVEGQLPQVTVIDQYRRWRLCPEAESLFEEAMEDDAVVLVNGIFLVKLSGKLTGLALEDVTLDDGTKIKAGTFYSPTDEESRKEIRLAADEGATHITLSQPSVWVFQRKAREEYASSLLEQARFVAAYLPDNQPMSAGMPRREYRLSHQEGSGRGDRRCQRV